MRSGPWRFFVITAVLALALTSAPLRAQETAKGSPVTLEQAVHSALQQNPAFRASGDDADAARARLKQVQSGWYPRVDFRLVSAGSTCQEGCFWGG